MNSKIFKILLLFIFLTTPAFAINDSWWDKYGDDALLENIDKLYSKNPDLKIALLKTKQMQEAVKMSFANELPQVGFTPNISREIRSSDIRFGELCIPDYNQARFLLPLSMTYEIDIYGKNHLATKSYKKLSEITLQDEKITKIIITSVFCSNYFNLIKTDNLIENQTKLVELQTQIAEMQNTKYSNGLCTKPEVISEQQALTLLKEDLNKLKTEREILKNSLTAMGVEDFELGNINNIKLIDFPETIDSSSITKRPDFIKSELYVKKTGLDVRVARRELLPSFTIYGDIGFNAYQLNKLFNHRTFLGGFGIMPNWDVFTGERKLANLRYKKLECKKALENYNKTVLTSVQELNDSLYRIKTSKQNYGESLKRNEFEQEKFNLTTRKFDIGAISNLDLLKEKRNTYIRENETISEKINYLVMTIELYKALGGNNFDNSL